jgi:uncharacterized membrane protein HdeD (DUF308 family)
MLRLLARNWWVFAVRGVIAIALGVLAFVDPEFTVRLIVALFAAYLLVDGISLLASYIRGDTEARRAGWTILVLGILGVGAGIAAFVWPGITAIWLLSLVAVWAIFMGVFQLVAAIRLRREIEGELLLAIGGLISIAFGAYLIVNPSAGLLALVWVVGFWAVSFGIVNLIFAWRLRSLDPRATDVDRGAAAPA